MKLTHESFTDFYPMLPGRHVSSGGANSMPNLRLRTVDQEESDSLPFPTHVSRIGRWQPKPLHERHEAEAALEQVQSHLDRLNTFLNNDDDDDRPRAA